LLIVLEAGSPRFWYQHGWVKVRTLFRVADSKLLAVSSHGRRDEELSQASFIKALIPFLIT